MFYGCSSLETLDLSSFDISKVSHSHYTFNDCSSLKYLDLSNFDTTSIKCSYEFIKGSSNKLEFVNFKKAKITNTLLEKYINNMIKINTKDIVFCVDILKTPLLNQFMEKNKCSESIYNGSYWIKYLEKIPVSNPCIDSCFNTSYIYEYSGKCYAKCSFENFFNNYICYDCIELGKCHELTANEFKNQIKDKITLYANSSKVIDGLNFLATISSSDEINPEEQLKNGISAFDLGNCTNVLKEYYDIPD